MYTKTLADAKASSTLTAIANNCSSSDKFLALLNEAQDGLMRRGSWYGTEWLCKFCIFDQCLTLPRYVASLNGIRPYGYGFMDIRNQWYAIEGKNGSCCWPNTVPLAYATNSAPTITGIANATGSPVRYYVEKTNDVGKTIRIHGYKYGGQPLTEKVDGAWVDGITLTAAKPYVQSSESITRITSIVRDATEAQARLYEVYDTSAGTLRLLGLYDPNETNPRYRQYNLENFVSCSSWNEAGGMGNQCTDDYGRQIYSVQAIVKIEFIPVANERDFLCIDVERALKFAMMAVQSEQERDIQGSEAWWLKAVHELNLEDRLREPKKQTQIRMVSAADGVFNPV